MVSEAVAILSLRCEDEDIVCSAWGHAAGFYPAVKSSDLTGTYRKYEGNTVIFSYYEPIPSFETPLSEGITPAGTPLSKVNIRATMGVYGSFVPFTDDLDIYGEDGANFISDVTSNLGGAAGETQEKLLIEAMEGNSTSIVFDTDIATTLKTAELALRNALGSKFTEMVTGSTNYGTTPIRPAYVSFITADAAMHLEDNLPGWKGVEDYGYSDGLLPNEVGSYRGLRFCESTVMTDDANGKTRAFIVAEEALFEVGIRGIKNIETIINELGSAGTKDPLNREGSVGSKFRFACQTRAEWCVEAILEA